ncbi:hypothetical protein QNI19_24695 [Cytophagaceae bacterium DM2B3-1]|uniref:DUF6249 domain-containing protein n=1 Tax=Xanthocytophaga flava TaxID=3048013 RepID=A0AAE3UA20_9BACT|nr:DUF6249 domain-containing protein [Xanthocytophaga flavus]MDJ1466820.1 hypothetical protein [Xanthocytophaga flavus]MDJ1482853.1 hypothetical protein [Xanthocytophaga flavus]MDJ1496159.1 hypothetical protein [Xanthocytophaga flavus]
MQVTSAIVLIALPLILTIFGIAYYYITARNKERMSVLEKGLPPDYFKDTPNFFPFILMLGIVSTGISLGIALGAYLWSLEIEAMRGFIFPFVIFFSLGISLIVSYFVLKSIQKKN